MSDHIEGKIFRGVQDRLKMFEQSKVTITMKSNQNPPENAPNRIIPPIVRKPPPNLDEITKQRLPIMNQYQPTSPCNKTASNAQKSTEMFAPKGSVQHKVLPMTSSQIAPVPPKKCLSPTKVTSEKIPPPTSAPPTKILQTIVTSSEKMNSQIFAPLTKSPQSTNVLLEKVTPPTGIPPKKVSQVLNSPLEKVPPPTGIPPTKVTPVINVYPEKVLPPTPALPEKALESIKPVKEKIPPPTPAPPLKIQPSTESNKNLQSSSTVTTTVMQEAENMKLSFEKVSHPQPPVPPPERLSNKGKTVIDFKATECPPPVPPPPPVITKTQSNVVVGWAMPSNNVFSGGINDKDKTKNIDVCPKIIEKNKPPPILAAPPSIASFEKANKQQNENISNTPEEEANEDDDFISTPWYFDISKAKATQIMRDSAEKGSYMVRPSDNNQYVLMIRAEADVIKKFKIQQHKTGWVLGDPSNWKRIHSSISKLMEFYCENGVKVGNSYIKLKEAVPKE